MAKKVDTTPYDIRHNQNVEKYARRILRVYLSVVREAIRIAQTVGEIPDGKVFSFADYPQTTKRINDLFAGMEKEVVAVIDDGTKREWLLSAQKNDKLVDAVVKSTSLSRSQVATYYQRNLEALTAFQARKTDGMGLSDRVWRHTKQLKNELELALDIGLGEGKSAAAISRDVRSYLNEPDKLFRRVRNKHGNLVLSKNAKSYNPGQGTYRSSYKNAMRLARTETNMAYRESDSLRWQQLDFVIGIEVKLSNNHTLNGALFVDICDELKGKYPKDFVFTGWHPQCRCFAIPILMDSDELEEAENILLEGGDVNAHSSKNEVKDVPDSFKKWLEDNRHRTAEGANQPYFIRDNQQYAYLSKNQYIRATQSTADKIDSASKDIAKELGIQVTPVNVKSTSRIYEKARVDYNGDIAKVRDIVRNTFICEEGKQDELLEKLQEQLNVVRIKVQSAADDPMGYSGILLNIRNNNGTFAEIQINSPQMIYAKETNAEGLLGKKLYNQIKKESGFESGLGHRYYEQLRSLSAQLDEEIKEEIITQSRAYYNKMRGVKL